MGIKLNKEEKGVLETYKKDLEELLSRVDKRKNVLIRHDRSKDRLDPKLELLK